MNKDQEVEKAKKEFHRLCKGRRYSPEQILSRRRQADIVDVRQSIAVELRGMGFSYPVIGEAMNRDHTSIQHLINVRWSRTLEFQQGQ